MERIDFVDLKTQYAGLRDEILAGLDHVMSRADFILGEPVRTFERTFAQYLGGPAGYGVASGTDALHLALRACGVGPGDEVITQANTFIATALAISYAGARPVLVDIDPATYLIDVERVRHAITPRTKAIIPVHLFGRAMDLTDLMGLAQHHGLAVIEDACQAHGAALDGRRAGTTGALGCFSFYPGKNLGAYGDGGYVLVNDPRLDAPIAMLRNYGQSKKYHHHILGFNSRLDSVQAVVLNVKLPRLDDWNRQRERLAALYRDRLRDLPVDLPAPAAPGGHVYHLFVIETDSRDELMTYLGQRGISTVIHYPIPIHLQEAYTELGYGPGAFPHTERAAQRLVSLPMFPELTEAHLARVCDGIADFFGSRP